MDVRISEEMAVRQLRKAEAMFDSAMACHPHAIQQSTVDFGGQTATLRIVGSELARGILRPFQHLKTDHPPRTDACLTIDLWDENEMGFRRSSAPPFVGRGWYAYAEIPPSGGIVTQRLPSMSLCFHRESAHVVGSVKWGDQLYLYEQGKPLSRQLVEWSVDRGIQVVHAGLVSLGERGILLVGGSGSGKSTAALACLIGELDFLSEDYVGLERSSEGEFMGYSLYSSLFLDRRELVRFPGLASKAIHGVHSDEEKSLLLLADLFPGRLRRSVPIRAVVHLRIAGTAHSKLLPVSKAEILMELGPASLLVIPQVRTPKQGRQGFELIAELIDHLPCHRLDAGHDLGSIPECLSELFETAESEG